MKLSHVAWNISGLAFPLLAALVSIPIILANVGQERFGLIALSWALLGYSSALDLGIGRALTQSISKLRASEDVTRIANIFFVGERITAIFSGTIFILFVVLVFSGLTDYIKVSAISRDDVRNAFLLMALALPLQALAATYRGVNEAYLNFKAISLLRASLGAINFVGPMLVSIYSKNIIYLLLPLIVSRIIALVVFRILAKNEINQDSLIRIFDINFRKIGKSLMNFGGWVSLSGVISPLMTQADRFVIAFILGASFVTIYSVPAEIVAQSLILVGALNTVFFPNLTNKQAISVKEAEEYFRKWLFRVSVLMGIVCLTMAAFLPWAVDYWLKNTAPEETWPIVRILAIGVFFNALGMIYYSYHHSIGNAKTTAMIHLLELPFYVFGLMFLINKYGVVGAAMAWTLRVAVDYMLLMILKKNKENKS